MTLLVNYSSKSQIQVTLSFPDTWQIADLKEKYRNMEALEADIYKVKKV